MKRTILFLAAAIMLGMSMPTMAQQKKAPAKRTTTTKTTKKPTAKKPVQQSQSIVLNEPMIVDGHLAFLGIPVNLPTETISQKLKEKGFVYSKTEYDMGSWVGMAYGVKSSVNIGKEPAYVSFREMKDYTKTQARNRVTSYQKAFVEATGGKVTENTMSYNSVEGGQVRIETSKGYIEINYGNQDEVDFSSKYYDVYVTIGEN